MFKSLNSWIILSVSLMFILTVGCDKQPQKQVVDFKTHYMQGLAHGIHGHFSKAKADFEATLQLQPLFTPAEGCLRIAVDAFDGKVTPKAAISLFKGINLGNQYKLKPKLRELNLAISAAPEYAPAYNERGITFYEMGKYRQALSDRNKSIALEPEYAASYYNKALVCEKLNLFREAISAYRGFIRRASDSSHEAHVEYSRVRIEELKDMLLEGQATS